MHRRHSKKKRLKKKLAKYKKWIVLASVAVIVLIISAIVGTINTHNNNDTEPYIESPKQESTTFNSTTIHYLTDDEAEIDREGFSAVDVTAQKCTASVLVPRSGFNSANLTVDNNSNNVRLSYIKSISCQADDIMVLQFAAKTANNAAKLQVAVDNVTCTVPLSKIKNQFYIPLTNLTAISSISFSAAAPDESIDISNLQLLNYGNAYSINQLTTGCYQLNDADITSINAKTLAADKAKSAVIDGDILYSVSGSPESRLSVYRLVDDGKPKRIGQLTGFGDARDIAFTQDKNAVIITARRNGAYIVDITSPEDPQILSVYDSIEYPTGICVNGNYAFICSRWFGVEVVDISDLKHPRFVCKLSADDEYQDCCFDDGILYVGVYNGKRIDVWDVHDLNAPQLLSKVSLDGSGQGVYVDGGYLYAATGLNSANTSSQLTDYGKGTGNGLEIYDIRNKSNIKWVSTVKFDGRFSNNSQDVWDVTVSDNKAYVSCMCYGTVVVDVSDVTAPRILKRIAVQADINTGRFIEYENQKSVYFFDPATESYGTVFHTVLADKKAYLIASNMGIYEYDDDDIQPPQETEIVPLSYSEKKNSLPVHDRFKFDSYDCNTQVWAIDKLGDYYVLACGAGGIHIIDRDLKLVKSYQTDYPVRDVKVFEDKIFTAEMKDGLGIYQWQNDSIQPLSKFNTNKDGFCVGSVALTHDGKFAVIESSMVSHYVVDVSDLYNPSEIKKDELGSVYYRSLCNGLVDGKYLGIFGSTNCTWYYSEDGELKQIPPKTDKVYSRSNGQIAYGNQCLALYNGGYVLFDPETNELSDTIRAENTTMEGKLSKWGDMLVISREYSGLLSLIDIQNVKHPKNVAEIHLDGNPDLAYDDGVYLLVPCRYGGLLRIMKR